MPTASGRPTADEKREAYRIRTREARLQVTAAIEPPEWYAAEADSFAAEILALRERIANGEAKSYESVERWYPVGDEHKVGRDKIDEGKARAYGVADVLTERGFDVHNVMQFGMFAGRQSIQYAVRGN